MQGLKLEPRQKLEQKQIQLQRQILRSELVQLPILALEARVKAELEENPFLEEVEDDIEKADAADSALQDTGEREKDDSELSKSQETVPEVNWDEFLNDVDHFEYRVSTRHRSEDGYDMPQPDIPTLSDHLFDQVRMDDFTEEEWIIAEEIIGNINRNGYLDVSLEEIELMTGVWRDQVHRVHQRIMSYDPIGIAARDIRECLLMQLAHNTPHHPITERMLREFWDDFVNKRYELLSEKLEVDLSEIKDAFEVVTRLNPKPGEGYFDERENYITPDLIVAQIGGEFVVYLNDGDLPNFRFSSTYRDIYLRQKGTDKKVKQFLSRKLESARWFLAAVHQRRTTMLRTMRAIVARQKDFFEKGPSFLKPMTLAPIAEDIEMDISTISRVTNGKYVQTVWGVFELKYFFTERMFTDTGDVSNRVIKQRLQELIDQEDKRKPLSDEKLMQILVAEGFQIKRRTVAKYRGQLRIPVQRLRRQI